MTFDSRWKNPQGSDPKQLFDWAQQLIKELRKGEFFDAAFDSNVGTGLINAQLADMAAWTIKARNAGTTGDPQDVARGDLTAATEPVNAHALLGFLSTNELRRFSTGNVGGLQLLNSGTVTNQATLDIVLTSFTAYRALLIRLDSFLPASDDVELWMRFSTDGGNNFDATGYSFANQGLRDDGVSADNSSASANQIVIAGDAGAGQSVYSSTAFGGAFAEVTLLGRTDTARHTMAQFDATYVMDGAGAVITTRQAGAGRRETAQDTDAVRFLFESGNIASGSWALYGFA